MLYSNFESNDIFSYENQRFSPKFKFINEDKIEFQRDCCDKFIKYLIIIIHSIFFFSFFIGIIESIIKHKWNLIFMYLFFIIIFFLHLMACLKAIKVTKYLEFNIYDMTFNIIEIDLINKKKVISYNLYEIKYFTHIFEDYSANFKIIYNDKEEEIIKFYGNYPETYKSLENFFNEKLQKITKRYNS